MQIFEKKHEIEPFSSYICKTKHFNFVSCDYIFIHKIKNKFFSSKYNLMILDDSSFGILFISIKFIEQFSNGCTAFGVSIVLVNALFICLFYRDD